MTRRGVRIILQSLKLLVAMGYAGFLGLGSTTHLAAQVTTSPGPDTLETPGATAAGGNSPDQSEPVAPGQNASGQNPPDSNAQTPGNPDQNSADQSRAQVPGVSQSPVNPTPTNIPQFPNQPGNPISPYTSSSANPQSPQLTAPSLYLTGANDLSQVGTNNALAQAFSGEGAAGFYSEPGMDYEHPPIERLRLGPFDLKAAMVTSVVADDNLRTNTGTGGGSGGSKSDISYNVTPAFLLEYGEHEGQKGYASLVYAPTFTRFIHHSDQNSDDYQSVAFNALYPFQRLTLNLSQTYSQTTGVNTDSNARTTQTSSFSLIGATYEIDDKLSTSTQVQYLDTTFSGPSGQGGGGGEGETTTSLNNNLSYRLSEKLTVGPNLNVGIDKPDNTSQQTFEQGFLGINYTPTEKIGLYAQGGAEFRQYEHNGSETNPIFSAGVGYTPFESTVISLGASQSVHTDINTNNTNGANAAMLNQTVVSTSLNAAVNQRVAQRFYFGFAFSYSQNDNQAGTGGSTAGGSNQTNMTYRPSLNFAPTAWSSVTLYYQYLSNNSDLAGSTYHDNQVGLSVSAQF